MVVLNRIYTRTGDDGTTSLGTGARRKKYDLRVEAYGTVDEVNAVIGLVRLHTARRQGARCRARPHPERSLRCRGRSLPCRERARRRPAHRDRCPGRLAGGEIDRLNAELAPLKSFILPGGSPASAYLHLARTVCRRAERIMVELKDKPGEGVSEPSLKYVNRLSDYLFVAGRYANDKGAARRAVGAGPEPLVCTCARSINVDRPMARPLASARSVQVPVRDGEL